MSERVFTERPEILSGMTDEIETPVGKAYVTLNYYKGKPVELFIRIGKAGSAECAAAEALARLVSTALQHDVPLQVLTRQLRGISSTDPLGFGPNKVLSLPDGVGILMENLNYQGDGK